MGNTYNYKNEAPKNKRLTRKYDGHKLEWLHALRSFCIILVVVFIVFYFLIGIKVVSGVSMNDTLKDGDIVIYTRLHSDYDRGDVVWLKLPTGEYYVKRVVAVAGDVVDIRNGILTVNGQPETGEYVKGSTKPEESTFFYPYTVEDGNVFVLGDNREESIDSRYFGAVPVQDVQGLLHAAFGFFFVHIL